MKKTLYSFLSGFLFCSLASSAYAGAMQDALCSILVNIVMSGIGDGAATIGVMAIGFGALMGKVSIGMAVTVAVGITILFGAGHIAYMILGVNAYGACPSLMTV